MATPKSYGFGVVPVRSAHHFFVVLPSVIGHPHVRIYERFHWSAEQGTDDSQRDAELGPDVSPVYRHGQRIEGSDILRLEVPLGKWEKLAKSVASEFNARLKKVELSAGKFTYGGVAISEDLGKELMVLLWAIKDADPGKVATAVASWLAFRPEERCWLYTMTNARHGGLDDRQGWRAALRDILCNGADESLTDLEVRNDDASVDSAMPTELNCDLPMRTRQDRSCNKKSFGAPEENGFFLMLPKAGEKTSFPYVYEGSADRAIARIPMYQWREVAHDVEETFNLRLAEDKLPKGKFASGVNGLSRLFGKELLVLLWTLEQVSKYSAQTVLRNWKVLMPEERWWLYTRTAASPKNWKQALREALGECGPREVQSSWF